MTKEYRDDLVKELKSRFEKEGIYLGIFVYAFIGFLIFMIYTELMNNNYDAIASILGIIAFFSFFIIGYIADKYVRKASKKYCEKNGHIYKLGTTLDGEIYHTCEICGYHEEKVERKQRFL